MVLMKMTDQDVANDILNNYKLLASSLNTYITESQNDTLRNDYIKILQETYHAQKQIFDLMNQKGWYQVKPADLSEIAKAQNEYAGVQL